MQNIGKNTQKHTTGGIIILSLLALLIGGFAQPAAAQIVQPTPLPQVVATQQAASAAQNQVNDLQAQRANLAAQLVEINRNIDNQIAAATQAAADARNAAATQNAVEAGAAIGRLEGALDQLKASYAGKDSIIADLQNRLEQQAAQIVIDTRTIDGLTLQLQQAQRDKQNALNMRDAALAQQKANQQDSMVSNAVKLIAVLTFLFALILFAVFVIPRRRAVVIEPPPAEPPLEGDYSVSDEG